LRVWCWGSDLRVQGLGFKIEGLRFSGQGLALRVKGLGKGLGFRALGFRVFSLEDKGFGLRFLV
jgi:hypothetical protein